VKAGELLIGNETNPYTGTAKIVLYGAQEDQYTVIEGAKNRIKFDERKWRLRAIP
jgi:hypothetical protein